MSQTAWEKPRRKFYIIAHGCNNLSKVNKAFRQKANGIECDLWADGNNNWWICHDGLFKTDLVKWLTHIGNAETKFKRQLALIIFDVKSVAPFSAVRDIINKHLPAGLPHIYSTSTIKDACMFADIVPRLARNEGIAVDEEDDPEKVTGFFKSIGASQCWYAYGITFIPLNAAFHISMQKAAVIRDSTGPFSKIYTWSVHRKSAIKKYIEEDKVDGIIVGLDGVFTSPVKNALEVVGENEEVELADRHTALF